MAPELNAAGRISQIAALIVFGMGCVVLIGWQFDIALPKTGIPGGVATTKANAALCFILLGAALLWVRSSPNRLWLTIWVAFPGWIALLTLGEYAFGWNLGIDQMLFADQVSSATPYPGRMGVNTAISVGLASAAIGLIGWRRSKLAQMLALLTLLICLQALIGYAFGVQVFYRMGAYTTPMALHTALSLVVLSVGILALQPEQGFMRALTANLDGGRLARQVLPTAILFPAGLGWLLIQGYKLNYYDPGFGMSLQVVLSILVQTGLIWQSVNQLNHNDLKRQWAETQLRESEARFRQIAESINDVFWMVDPIACELLYISPQYSEIWGRSCESLRKHWQSWLEAIHPEDRDRVEQALFQISPTQNYSEEFRIIRPDGSIRWVRDRGYPVLDALGQVQCISGIAEDITERKQIEAERDSFFTLSLDMLSIAGMDGYFKRLNPAFERTLGHSKAELMAHPFIEFVHPDDRAATLAEISKLRDGQPTLHFENRYRCKDGSYRWLDWVTAPVIEQNMLYAVAHDVTQRKQAETALRENEARLNSFVEADLIGILYGDIYGKISYVNDEMLSILGYSREDLQFGKLDWIKITPSEYLPLDELGISEAQSRGACTPYEKEYIRKDGSCVSVLIGYRLLEPNREQSVAFVLNLSAQKQAEVDLREGEARFRADLELRVKERTVQLELANRELESFSYSVSHDLRAPLRHIAGFVELLQKRLDPATLDATSQRYLTIIAETTRQAGTLIDDLLAFSRMVRSEMRSIPIDMNLLVQELQRQLEPDLAGRQINWQIEPLPSIEGDPPMLRLALRNLLENAIKYTRQQPLAEITIGSFSRNQAAVFFIKDNGIGFNMQYTHKLFGIFQRLHSDPEYEGTGIGLANVQRIVHRHGGEIWAEGKVNEGATFFFSLPEASELKATDQ